MLLAHTQALDKGTAQASRCEQGAHITMRIMIEGCFTIVCLLCVQILKILEPVKMS